VVKGVAGDGIGRYGSAHLADETFRPDGTAALIRTDGYGGLEFHFELEAGRLSVGRLGIRVSRCLYRVHQYCGNSDSGDSGDGNFAGHSGHYAHDDFDGGHWRVWLAVRQPYWSRSAGRMQHRTAGDGIVYTGQPAGLALGTSGIITEGTLGFWHKFYSGPKGGLHWGIQYSYFAKRGQRWPAGWHSGRLAEGGRQYDLDVVPLLHTVDRR
jgi:hypothetical protein